VILKLVKLIVSCSCGDKATVNMNKIS